jgi:PucR family transcriptional regulator, purine catabolism regulatory protein
MNELKLTVRDVLARETFKCARLIAGVEGLDRQVKWSHILETKDFESLINGGELILTTGVGLQLDLASQTKYIKSLIEKDVAGICIEIGSSFKEIPTEIIELANEHDFPIVVFEEIVKFVDITQDLHTFIINQHHQMLSQLDTLSRKFISLSLTHNGILKILQELHELFQQNTFFISANMKPFYYPSVCKDIEVSIRETIEMSPMTNKEQGIITLGDRTFALMPVRGLGQTWGYLCLQIKTPMAKDFLFLLLDRAALAIAQILLRNRTIEERKQNMEDELVRNLLHGREYEQEDIHSYLPTPSRNMHFRVFIIHLDFPEINLSEEDWEEIKLQRSMMIRSLFKRNGFFPAVSTRKNEIAVIASFIAADHLKKETDRFSQIITHISNIEENNFIEGCKCNFGVSTVYDDISDAMTGYEEASKVLELHESQITKTNFYENLGIYRLLLFLKESNYLEKYVNEYLSPVLDYDRETAGNLFETLTVYLKCSGSKKETSDRLFIVRQTLYHRLERLETLLGKDFMEPSNRLAIEVAIKAYKLLENCSKNQANKSLNF